MAARRAPSGLIVWMSVESVLAWLLRGIARLRPERAAVIGEALRRARVVARASAAKGAADGQAGE